MRRRSHGEHSAVGGSSREEQISLIKSRNEAAATEATGVLICVASLLRCDRSGLIYENFTLAKLLLRSLKTPERHCIQ
jgi:hypothetical protein